VKSPVYDNFGLPAITSGRISASTIPLEAGHTSIISCLEHQVGRTLMRPLFSGVDIAELKQHHEQQAKETVRQLSPKMFDRDDADIASRIVADFTLELPVIDESHVYTVKSGDEITTHIPFTGDFSLFEVKPSCHGPNPPLGEVDAKKSEVLVTHKGGSSISQEQTVREIKQYLEWLRPEITDTKWLREKVLHQIAKAKAGG
jgi:hypothetical protein